MPASRAEAQAARRCSSLARYTASWSPRFHSLSIRDDERRRAARLRVRITLTIGSKISRDAPVSQQSQKAPQHFRTGEARALAAAAAEIHDGQILAA